MTNPIDLKVSHANYIFADDTARSISLPMSRIGHPQQRWKMTMTRKMKNNEDLPPSKCYIIGMCTRLDSIGQIELERVVAPRGIDLTTDSMLRFLGKAIRSLQEVGIEPVRPTEETPEKLARLYRTALIASVLVD